MNVEGKLRAKITLGYIVILIVGISMTILLLHERKRMQQIETETEDIRHVRLDINTVHHRIATLAILGENIIGWEKADSTRYRVLRLRTDSLLQALKPHCRKYVRPAQIDTLRSLLADKETHLRHIMEAMERQDEADSLMVNHLPEVARRATSSAYGAKRVLMVCHLSEVSSSRTPRRGTAIVSFRAMI